IASCVASVNGVPILSGAAIDTSSAGPGTFIVTATDTFLNPSTTTVNYAVVDPPRIVVTSPLEPIYELNSLVLLHFDCVNGTCTSPVANDTPIDTSTPGGPNTFRITATAFGYETFEDVTYSVSLGTCVPPFGGMTAWLPGDGDTSEPIAGVPAVWTGPDTY